jgi:methylated-DNA-[protein]-cysteine S-methyltransferase
LSEHGVDSLVVPTPFGRPLYVACSGDGITDSRFTRAGRSSGHGATAVRKRHAILGAALEQLDAYFAGRPGRLDVPLVLAGTPLQLAVWRAVAQLCAGEIASYGEIARAIGRPNAHRGVAAALARTPLALFVPAHRVVGADGRIKGATPGSMRRRLAAFEGLPVR